MQKHYDIERSGLATAVSHAAHAQTRRSLVLAALFAVLVAFVCFLLQPMHAFASTDSNNDSMCTASTQAVATSNGDTAVKLETQNAISDGIDAGQVEIVTLASTSSGKASPGDEPGSSGTKGPGDAAKADSASNEDSATDSVAGSSSILGTVNSADADSNPDSADSAQDTADESAGENADCDVDANVAKPSLNDNKAEGPDSTQTTTSDQANASASSPGVAEDVSITQPTTSDQANAAGDSSSVVEGGETADTATDEVYGPVRYLDTPADVYGPVRFTNLEPQTAGATITIHFFDSFSSPVGGSLTSPRSPDVQVGHAQDPIFSSSGQFLGRVSGTYTGTNLTTLASTYDSPKRYGYSFKNWFMTYTINNPKTGATTYGAMMQNSGNLARFATQINNANMSDYHIYAIWNPPSTKSVQFIDSKNAPIDSMSGSIDWTTSITVPTSSNCPSSNTLVDPFEYYWEMDTDHSKPLTQPTYTLGDLLDHLHGFRSSSENYTESYYHGMTFNAVAVEVKVSFDVTYDPNGATSGTAQEEHLRQPCCYRRCAARGLG